MSPCEGTGYEIGSMSIIKGAKNMENAKKWYDWALTPDRRLYRTLGMAVAGGEDLEIAIVHPDSEVELDSAESALLFGCHLQAREARLLEDGEVFYVPKDVRVGPRGASATARTGYKYLVARPPAQPAGSIASERVRLVRG